MSFDFGFFSKYNVYCKTNLFTEQVLSRYPVKPNSVQDYYTNTIACFDHAVNHPPTTLLEDKIMAINLLGGRMYLSECYGQGWLRSGIFGAVGLIQIGFPPIGEHPYRVFEKIEVSPSYRSFYRNSMSVIVDSKLPIRQRYMFALLLPHLHQKDREGGMQLAMAAALQHPLSYGNYISPPALNTGVTPCQSSSSLPL